MGFLEATRFLVSVAELTKINPGNKKWKRLLLKTSLCSPQEEGRGQHEGDLNLSSRTAELIGIARRRTPELKGKARRRTPELIGIARGKKTNDSQDRVKRCLSCYTHHFIMTRMINKA